MVHLGPLLNYFFWYQALLTACQCTPYFSLVAQLDIIFICVYKYMPAFLAQWNEDKTCVLFIIIISGVYQWSSIRHWKRI